MSVNEQHTPSSAVEEEIVVESGYSLVEHLANASPKEVLAKLVQIPIYTWNYNWDDPGIRHLGPMSQDFYAAFGVGVNDQSICYIDSIGVCLASIQALNEMVQENAARIEHQQKQLDRQTTALAELERLLGQTKQVQ